MPQSSSVVRHGRQTLFHEKQLISDEIISDVYIRPSLEYASIICNPREIGANMQLERVQKCFTRRLFGWSVPSYEDRFALLGVPSLCTTRKNADKVFICTLWHNIVDINSEPLGTRLCDGNTRGSGVNLALHRASTELIKSTFSYRVQRQRNKLPLLTNSAPSLATFKSKIV